MDFTTTVILGGKTATGIPVPEDVVTALDAGRRPRVYVTINGHTYRSTVAVFGGESMLPLSAENREAAGVAAGDEIVVSIRLDEDPREVELPEDLVGALEDAGIRTAFDALSYSRQRAIVLNVEGAKTAGTRDRRIAKAVADLA